MKVKGNRKNFLKTKSITVAAIVMLYFAICISASSADRDGMITIVMASDYYCYVNGVVNQQRVQDMVNASIVEVTQVIDDISFAYECLFPYGGITEGTKIVIKYNPKSPEVTRKPMTEALKTGLTYMLDYTFPASNITIVGDSGTAGTTDTIMVDSTVIVYDTTIFTFDSLGNPDTIIVSTATTIYAWDSQGNPDTIIVPTPTTPSDTIPGQNLKYAIKDVYSDADYIIYCPSAYGTDIGCGVDMCLSLMLTSIEGLDTATKVEDMYPLFHDTISPSLSLLNYHPTFNGDFEKVVLYMMDLISYSGTGDSADLQPGNKIYTTKNITVCDWKGIRFLKDSVGAIDSIQEQQALKVCSLSCHPYVDLGVVNEGQMLEIHIIPGWTIGVTTDAIKIFSKNIQVKTNPAHTIFSYPREMGSDAVITIYDIHGREIWSHRSVEKSIVWNNNNLDGYKVPSGVYIYNLKVGKNKGRGRVTIKQ